MPNNNQPKIITREELYELVWTNTLDPLCSGLPHLLTMEEYLAHTPYG